MQDDKFKVFWQWPNLQVHVASMYKKQTANELGPTLDVSFAKAKITLLRNPNHLFGLFSEKKKWFFW